MATLSAAALAPVSSRVSSANVAPSPNSTPEPAPKPANSNASQVRYLSPVIEIDAEAGLALLQVRNAENGDVRFQLPPERVVREYKSTEAATSQPTEPSRADSGPVDSGRVDSGQVDSGRTDPGLDARPVTTAAEAATTSSLTSTNPAAAKQA